MRNGHSVSLSIKDIRSKCGKKKQKKFPVIWRLGETRHIRKLANFQGHYSESLRKIDYVWYVNTSKDASVQTSRHIALEKDANPLHKTVFDKFLECVIKIMV